MNQTGIEIIRMDPSQKNSKGRRMTADAAPDSGQYEKLKLITHSLLTVLGQDPNREGLRRTPQRMARMPCRFRRRRFPPESSVRRWLRDRVHR